MPSCYPQIVNLGEYAGFQIIINDVISKIIMYEADALREDDIVSATKTSPQVFWVNTMTD
jgi:hypothetical protein